MSSDSVSSEPRYPLAIPVETQPPKRIVALTEAGKSLPLAYSRLIEALRAQGTQVLPLAVPPTTVEALSNDLGSLADLKRGIKNIARDFLGRAIPQPHVAPPEPWLASQLRAVEGTVDAVIALDPKLARETFSICEQIWPDVLRLGLDADYHLEGAWNEVAFDHIITPHPSLGGDLARVREGRARTFYGGPLYLNEGEIKQADPNLPQVTVSFARLDHGDIDTLLFQLSLARPERFSLLFLPSGRPDIDELVRTRAGHYGLRGKRPRVDADLAPWIAGSSVFVGRFSPEEAAIAVSAKVPLLLIGQERNLSAGERFLLQHGALNAEVPLTIAVMLESLLPGGQQRETAITALSELEPNGPKGAAEATLAAIRTGRTLPFQQATSTAPVQEEDSELEDIGQTVVRPQPTGTYTSGSYDMPMALRRSYLKEIILQHSQAERNLGKAKAGLDTWQRRVRLARTANDHVLADKAVTRVEGLLRILTQLEEEEKGLRQLRARFSSTEPLTASDIEIASRFMGAHTPYGVNQEHTPESAFQKLEIDDALASLKRKLGGA